MRLSTSAFSLFAATVIYGCHLGPPRNIDTSDRCVGESARASVLGAMNEFADAFRTGDVKRAEALLHARYVHTNGGAEPMTRTEWTKWFRTRSEEIERGAFRFVDYDVSGVEAEFFSRTAVITGLVATRFSRLSAMRQATVRFTQIWTCEGGDWKRIAFHDTQLE